MAQQTDADDEVLPFNLRTPREGVGPVEDIVDLSSYTGTARHVYEGRCRRCDYDRGTRKRHTEVDGEVLVCRNCETVLHRE